MARPAQHRILLIGDHDRQLQGAVAQSMPAAAIRHVPNVFDGICELSADAYSAVLAAVEPIGRRPEAAVRTLRDLAGEGRVVLFGDSSLEPLSRRMLQFGCDDYLVTPVSGAQIHKILSAVENPSPPAGDAPLRLHTDYDDPRMAKPPVRAAESRPTEMPPAPQPIWMPQPAPAPLTERSRGADLRLSTADSGDAGLAVTSILGNPFVADIVLEAMLEHPGDAMNYAISQLNSRLGGGSGGTGNGGGGAIQLSYSPASTGNAPPINTRDGRVQISHTIQSPSGPLGSLILTMPAAQEGIGKLLLAELGPLLAKTAIIQRRQTRLQKLAFTDDLTGLFNCPYFKHFLTRILGEAAKSLFPVTLFLFDIDNFKHYNDRYGHGVGDDILKQTSDLMRRCVRDHDLVARIGGDEFAVVFWEKEGPRASRDQNPGASGRPPTEPQQILARFQRLLQSQNYPLLGSTGRGSLTISGGLAVFPYHASDLQGLIDAADKALMFGAKRSGRNSIALVGGESTRPPVS